MANLYAKLVHLPLYIIRRNIIEKKNGITLRKNPQFYQNVTLWPFLHQATDSWYINIPYSHYNYYLERGLFIETIGLDLD